MGAIATTLVQVCTLVPGAVFVFFFLRNKSNILRLAFAIFLGWLLSLVGWFISLYIVFEAGFGGKSPTDMIVAALGSGFWFSLISPFFGIYFAKKHRTKVRDN